LKWGNQMKRIAAFSLMLSTLILLITIPSIVKAESSKSWETWPSKKEVDIDKKWVIHFDREMDWRNLWGNIYLVRESDNKRVETIIPDLYGSNGKAVGLHLTDLYEFGETYHLYIENVKATNGKALKKPIKMTFQTVNPEFNLQKTIVQDGIEFQIMVNTKEVSKNKKLYAKIKATNISEESIPYWGRDGCDLGFSASIFAENPGSETEEGSKWKSASRCTLSLEQYHLAPGETLETVEVLYPPADQLNGHLYLNIQFQKGLLEDNSSINRIELPITLNEFN